MGNVPTGGPPDEVQAIIVTFNHQLDDKRTIGFQTALASDLSEAEMNARLDVLSKASNRQYALARLPTLNLLLDIKADQLKKAEGKLVDVENSVSAAQKRFAAEDVMGGRRKPQDTPARRQEIQRIEAEAVRYRGDVFALKQDIEQLSVEAEMLRKRVEGGAAEA